jgi:hypothetical protein
LVLQVMPFALLAVLLPFGASRSLDSATKPSFFATDSCASRRPTYVPSTYRMVVSIGLCRSICWIFERGGPISAWRVADVARSRWGNFRLQSSSRGPTLQPLASIQSRENCH